MAAPVVQSGAMVPCPSCGNEVMQKSMIPVGVTNEVTSYLCVSCARKLVKTGSVPPAEGDASVS